MNSGSCSQMTTSCKCAIDPSLMKSSLCFEMVIDAKDLLEQGARACFPTIHDVIRLSVL